MLSIIARNTIYITKITSQLKLSKKVSVNNCEESAVSSGAMGAQTAVFFLCESCHWCATYLEKSRFQFMSDCPSCSGDLISSFPILPTESFKFGYNDRRGVELDFERREP